MAEGPGEGIELNERERGFDDAAAEDAREEERNQYEQIGQALGESAEQRNQYDRVNMQEGIEQAQQAQYQQLELRALDDLGQAQANGFHDAPADGQPDPDPPSDEESEVTEELDVDLSANPGAERYCRQKSMGMTLGLVGGLAFLAGGIGIGYALWGTRQAANGKKLDGATDEMNATLKKMVDDWNNKVTEPLFWQAVMDWIAKDKPSIKAQLYVISYANSIATPEPTALTDDQAKTLLDGLLKVWNDSKKNQTELYKATSTLALDGKEVTRWRKLRTLDLVLVKIIAGTDTPGDDGGNGGSNVFIISDTDDGFKTVGDGWREVTPTDTGPILGKTYWTLVDGQPTDTATWAIPQLDAGDYLVSITWVKTQQGANAVPVEILDGTTSLFSGTIDQSVDPQGDQVFNGVNFQTLKTVRVTTGPLSVVLQGAPGRVTAEGIRVEKQSKSNPTA